jgi:hypothetical protein
LEEIGVLMDIEQDIFLEFIQGLDLNLPTKGLSSPEIENIIDDTKEIDGSVLKISVDLYFFMNHSQSKYYMLSSNQHMQQLGTMPLKDAVLKFSKKTKKR